MMKLNEDEEEGMVGPTMPPTGPDFETIEPVKWAIVKCSSDNNIYLFINTQGLAIKSGTKVIFTPTTDRIKGKDINMAENVRIDES